MLPSLVYNWASHRRSNLRPQEDSSAHTVDRASGNQTVVASGHLFYLSHGNLGNFHTGQKGEFRQRY